MCIGALTTQVNNRLIYATNIPRGQRSFHRPLLDQYTPYNTITIAFLVLQLMQETHVVNIVVI